MGVTRLPSESMRVSGGVPRPLMTVLVRLIACRGMRGGFMRDVADLIDGVSVDDGGLGEVVVVQ